MKLEEWEKLCPDCKGKGYITEKNYEIGATTKYTCPRCCGDGKFDWLENVFGKKRLRLYTGIAPPANAKIGDITINSSGIYSYFDGKIWIQI